VGNVTALLPGRSLVSLTRSVSTASSELRQGEEAGSNSKRLVLVAVKKILQPQDYRCQASSLTAHYCKINFGHGNSFVTRRHVIYFLTAGIVSFEFAH